MIEDVICLIGSVIWIDKMVDHEMHLCSVFVPGYYIIDLITNVVVIGLGIYGEIRDQHNSFKNNAISLMYISNRVKTKGRKGWRDGEK